MICSYLHITGLRLLCSVVFLSFMLSSCLSGKNELPKVDDRIDLTKDQASDVTLIISQKAKVQTQITAPVMIRNENIVPPYAEMPSGLKALFYNDSLIVTTELTAEYARYYEKEQNVILQKNVVVTNLIDSTVLKTEELIWNNELEKFYTEKDVHINRKGYITTGTGLEANRDLTVVKITRQKSIIPIDDSTQPGLASPGGMDNMPTEEAPLPQSDPDRLPRPSSSGTSTRQQDSI